MTTGRQEDNHEVTVVIPTIGRPSIEFCLEGLRSQTRPPDEIVRIDDVDRRGISWSRNEGIRRSKGDLIAFIDDDAVPPPEWLERLIGAVDRFGADAAGGTYEESDPLLQEIRALTPCHAEEGIDRAGLVGNGGNIIVRRASLDRLLQEDGYVFNEAWKNASEDWEFVARLQRLGAVLAWVPVPVRHLRRARPLQHLTHQLNRGIGVAQLEAYIRTFMRGKGPHQSLLWGFATEGEAGPRWLTIFRQKLLGPFNARQFSSASRFLTYWAGEKAKGFGYLLGRLRRARGKLPLLPPQALSQSK